MADLDLDALPAWLSTRRWFGGKGRPIASVRVADEARLRHLRVLTLEVAYRSGPSPERYLVPLREGMDVPLEEALDEESCRIVFGILRERREVRTREGVLRGERFDAQGSALDALPERPGVRRLSAEQSNTSLVFGDAVILKLIRKLVPGRNPELEVGALLARRGFRSTPALLAALTLSNDVEATVGVAHRFVQVDCDGWSYVLEALARDGGVSVALLEEVRELGARVGEMHVALADPDDPAFAPEAYTALDQRSVYQAKRNLTGKVLRLLRSTHLQGRPAELAQQLLAREADIYAAFDPLLRGRLTAHRGRIH
ncbi:MAG TPA: sugar phosphotransferase, partial [Myxococcales bacterium]|nr:sugar phosphotransferase [Myxococcales bacterium]